MDILVIGGTGFISGRLVKLLVRDGHGVTVLTRGRSPLTFESLTHITADRSDPAALAEALAGSRFDVVYDMVAYAPDESATVVKLLSGRTERLIHCSTISVNMVSDRVHCPVTEDQDKLPLMPHWPANPFGMDYGIAKRGCEDVLWEAHARGDFSVTMLRPAFVSGPRDPVRRDWFWIERILDGGPLLVPGSGDHAFQQVFVDDVARSFVRLLAVPGSQGRAYNIVGEEIHSLNEYIERVAALLGREPQIVPVRHKMFDRLPFATVQGADAFPFDTRRTAVFDLNRAREELGYRSTPFDHWMTETIAWFQKRGEPSVGYANRDLEIRFAANWSRRVRLASAEFDTEASAS